MKQSVIVLNADYSFLSCISVQRAFKIIYEGLATVVKETDRIICTVSQEFFVPAVIVLIKQVRTHFRAAVTFSRRNIFIRDKYTCQYCGKKITEKNGELEHVLPSSRGGKTNFSNCVASCRPCNIKKADKRPHEVGMSLKRVPFQPTIGEWLQMRMRMNGIETELKELGVY